MGLIEQIGRAIAKGDAPFSPASVEGEARRKLHTSAPWTVERNVGSVVDHVLGMGPISPWLADPTTTDIVVNGPEEVWVDRGLFTTREKAEAAAVLCRDVDRDRIIEARLCAYRRDSWGSSTDAQCFQRDDGRRLVDTLGEFESSG